MDETDQISMFAAQRHASDPLFMYVAKKLLRLCFILFLINLFEDVCFVFLDLDRRYFFLTFLILVCLVDYKKILRPPVIVFILLIIGLMLAFPIFTLFLWMSSNNPYFNYTTPYLTFLKFAVTGDLKPCITHAVNVGNGKLGFCGEQSFEHGHWMLSVPYEKEFVYDSSDQLSLPFEARSQEWHQKAEELFSIQEGYQLHSHVVGKYGPIKPVYKEFFGNITHIGGHFYYVSI